MNQVNSIKVKFPEFKLKYGPSMLIVVALIRPTSRSVLYNVKIKYVLHQPPKIWVLQPELVRNSANERIPHMFKQERLYLYQPKYREFKFSDYLSETIIPWISLWLYHYENWLVTGEWTGGGEHPE